MISFADLGLNKQLIQATEVLGYTEPTPIQEKAIPIIIAGHDVLGVAQTGTGKTAAYCLPILFKLKYAQGTHPRALIVAPTRELAIQINEDLHGFAAFTDLRHIAIYGGLGPKTQKERIAAGIDILVATPGRLIDLYLNGDLILKELKILVLDEADKMMDMGFMPQIRRLLEVIPTKRQNLLFSATMPDKVLRLSKEFLEYPQEIEIAPQATTVEAITQRAFTVANLQTKLNLLLHLLKDEEAFNRVMVFVKTKEQAETVFHYLQRKKVGEVKVIHANKGQNTRINSMDAFRSGEVRVLIATDVASRGLDIYKVSQVINFDVPIIYEDYVHRIGRTGRAKEVGEAITFITVADEWHIKKIEALIRMEIPREYIPSEVDIAETPFDEQQSYLREIDRQKRRDNPDFQGAFHEKKNAADFQMSKKSLGYGTVSSNKHPRAAAASAKKNAEKNGLIAPTKKKASSNYKPAKGRSGSKGKGK